MAYKNQKKNKKHIAELKKDRTNWRNKQKRKANNNYSDEKYRQELEKMANQMGLKF